jgi:hypothetical protein
VAHAKSTSRHGFLLSIGGISVKQTLIYLKSTIKQAKWQGFAAKSFQPVEKGKRKRLACCICCVFGVIYLCVKVWLPAGFCRFRAHHAGLEMECGHATTRKETITHKQELRYRFFPMFSMILGGPSLVVL